jgi:hypothetical protein
MCETGENCFNCPQDCGVCDFCGDGKCESDETCANCPQDCGACPEETCIQVVTCAFGCFSGGGLSLSCILGCTDGACPNAINAANNVIDCATMNCLMMGGGGGGGILACVMSKCSSQLESCIDTSCMEM